jgi:hypothetical protein
MAYEVNWANEAKTVLHQIYHTQPNVTDYYQVADSSRDLLASVEHSVDLIIELRDKQFDVKGFLSATSSVNRRIPPNQRLVIIVGSTAIVRALLEIVLVNEHKSRNPNERVHFVDSLEKAYTIIEEHSATL